LAKTKTIKSATNLATVTNTVTETTLGSVTIPAYNVKMNHLLKVKVMVKTPSTNSTDTLAVKLKVGSTVLATVAAFDAANDDVCWVELSGYVDSVTKELHYVSQDGRTGQAADVEEVADVAFDVDADLVISATATWSVASASNQAVPKFLSVELEPCDGSN
jgi:hypothetical protein